MIDANRRIKTLTKQIKIDPVYIPRSICRRLSGEVVQYEGLTVLQPFLDGEFSEVATDDPETAYLLRSMDTGKTVTVEIISLNGEKLKRKKI